MPLRLAAFLLLALGSRPAAAHAILMESQPPSGGTIASGPTHIALRYNSRIDQARSRLELRAPGQLPAVLALEPASDDSLAADATLSPGNWVLRWQVLAVDGHITRGDVPLTVQAATTSAAK